MSGTPFKPIPTDIFPENVRPHIAGLNRYLSDQSRVLALLEVATTSLMSSGADGAGVRGAIGEGVNPNPRRDRSRLGAPRVHTSRVTPDSTTVFNGSSTATGVPNLTLGLTNSIGTTTYAVATDAGIRFPLTTDSVWGRTGMDVVGVTVAASSVLGRSNAHLGSLSFASLSSLLGLSVSGGSTTQVLFNDGGTIGSEANLVWNKTTNVLGVTGGIRGVSHAFIGGGGAVTGVLDIQQPYILSVAEDMTQNPGVQVGLVGGIGADGDAATATIAGCQFNVTVADGYDPDRAGGGPGIIYGNNIFIAGSATDGISGTIANIHGLDIEVIPTFGATYTVSNSAAINVTNNTISGPTPLNSYGAVVRILGSGSNETAAFAGVGNFKVATTNKVQWGRAIGTASTNSMRARTSLGSNLVMELASADTYEWSTSAYFPAAGGTRTCGQNGNGWSAFVWKDTSASFEVFGRCQSRTALTADRVFTLDLDNVSRGLGFSGTANGITFGLGGANRYLGFTGSASNLEFNIGSADVGVTFSGGPVLLNNWFDQSVKIAATPTFGSLMLTDGSNGVEVVASGGGSTKFLPLSTETLVRSIQFGHGGVNRTIGLSGTGARLDIDLGTTIKTLDLRSQRRVTMLATYQSRTVPTTAGEGVTGITNPNFRHLIDLAGMSECRLQVSGDTATGSTFSALYIEGSSAPSGAFAQTGFSALTASGLSIMLATNGASWTSWQSLNSVHKVDGVHLRFMTINTSGTTAGSANIIDNVTVEFR